MARTLTLDIGAEMFSRLERLAERDAVSVDAEARRLLEDALTGIERRADRLARADAIAALTPKGVAQTPAEVLLREDRDR